MRKHQIQLILILLAGLTLILQAGSFAQSGIAPSFMAVDGYIILSNGDTLFGKLKWKLKYIENNPVEIEFFAENGSSKILNAKDTPGFGNYTRPVKEDFDTPMDLELENYVSLPSFKKGVPVFYNRLLEGPLQVYLNRSSNQLGGDKTEAVSRIDGIYFSFSPGEGLEIGPTYHSSFRIIKGHLRHSSYFVIKDNEQMIKINRGNFEEYFDSLFGDCEKINEEIKKNPDLLKFKNFFLLCEIYNQLMIQDKDE